MREFLMGLLPYDNQQTILNAAPEQADSMLAGYILWMILLSVLYIVIFIVLLKVNKRFFRRIENRRGSSITFQFLEKAIMLAIIVYFVVIPLGGEKLSQSLLGSTAVIAAVVGLAANDVIKDMFAGLQIGIYKPFNVGSRICFEDGTAGIVEKLTLRHVVIKKIDTTRIIIPNSKANTLSLTNYSYDNVPRSVEMHYNVSYKTDVEKAKEIIRRTIVDCPLTLNADVYDEKNPNSRSVYFLELTDSAIVLGATIYYSMDLRTEVVKDEVNTRVFEALGNAGIEVPYEYVNVVMKN